MMAFRLNWASLTKLQQELIQHGFEEDTPLIVVIVLDDGKPQKTSIKLRDLLQFMWSISETNMPQIDKLFVQGPTGKVLYHQKQGVRIEKKKPSQGGNMQQLAYWNALTQEEKDLLVKLTIAQINAYGR